MRIRLVLIVIALCGSIQMLACINEYRTKLSGEADMLPLQSGKVHSVFYEGRRPEELKRDSIFLFEKYKQTDSLHYLSDYAAVLVFLGNYEVAKQIYFEIEKKQPDLYTTASNLGTIYELIGKPDSALLWIKKSIIKNPGSHNGSEWIHIRILEFKINGNKNYTASILGLDFGNKEIPNNPRQYNLEQLEYDIRHQLTERLYFIKPKDKIVGNIYFDYGNIMAQRYDLETALESYYEAKRFGFESAVMERRIKTFEEMVKEAKDAKEWNDLIQRNIVLILLLGSFLLLAFVSGGAYFIYRFIKKRKNQS